MTLVAPSGEEPPRQAPGFPRPSADGALDGRGVALLAGPAKDRRHPSPRKAISRPRHRGEATGRTADRRRSGPRTRIAPRVEISVTGVARDGATGRRLDRHQGRWACRWGQPFRQTDWDAPSSSCSTPSAPATTPRQRSPGRGGGDRHRQRRLLTVQVDSGPALPVSVRWRVTGLVVLTSPSSRYRRPRRAALQPGTPAAFQTAQNTSYFASVVVTSTATAKPLARPCRSTAGHPPGQAAPAQGLVWAWQQHRLPGRDQLPGCPFPWRTVQPRQRPADRAAPPRAHMDVFLPPTLDGYLDSVGALVEHTSPACRPAGSRLVWSARFRGQDRKPPSATSTKCWRPDAACAPAGR